MHRFALAALAAFAGLAAATPAPDAELEVVATLSTFADLVKTVGGDHVSVSYVAPPTFNPHFIEPRPSDVVKLKRADLFVHAGLDLELWRWPLVEAAGNLEAKPGGDGELDLSQGIHLLEVPTHPLSRAEGDIHIYGNPHYWVDPRNGRHMALLIADKLAELDPGHAQVYHDRAAAFAARLDERIAAWRERLRPYQGAELVDYHNSWPYFMQFAGLRAEQHLEPKPGIPPTPKHRKSLESYIREHHVRAIIQETFFPTRATDAVAKATGVPTVLLCQNVGEVPEAADYIAMIEYNVSQLEKALR